MTTRRRRLTSLAGVGGLLVAAAVFAAPAQAGGWTQVAGSHHGYVFACKAAVNSAYGPLWRVNVFMSNYYSDHGHNGGVTVRRYDPTAGPVIHSWNVTLAPGQTSGQGTVYLSRLLPDTLTAGAGELNGEGSGGNVSMSSVAYC